MWAVILTTAAGTKTQSRWQQQRENTGNILYSGTDFDIYCMFMAEASVSEELLRTQEMLS